MYQLLLCTLSAGLYFQLKTELSLLFLYFFLYLYLYFEQDLYLYKSQDCSLSCWVFARVCVWVTQSSSGQRANIIHVSQTGIWILTQLSGLTELAFAWLISKAQNFHWKIWKVSIIFSSMSFIWRRDIHPSSSVQSENANLPIRVSYISWIAFKSTTFGNCSFFLKMLLLYLHYTTARHAIHCIGPILQISKC